MLDEPLGLTVHSLPMPQEALAQDARRTLSGRMKMLLVMLVCAAPVVASYLTYYVIRPDARRSYGELIEPQRPLPAASATTLDGKPVRLASLKGQWLLVSVAGGGCDSECEKHLYLQRQLRESLGKDKDRVDWVWLVPDDAPVRDALRPALAQAIVLRVDEQKLGTWLSPANGRAIADHLYVVDPMGNWMLRFPAGLDLAGAAKAKRDIERLLRASASWDEPGRPAQ
jgi:cytochrome oxidase Cu insertion factor (SCO1/SenC/PrrC family)